MKIIKCKIKRRFPWFMKNRKVQCYTCSITKEELRKAFESAEEYDNFIDMLTESIYLHSIREEIANEIQR